jgi:hypothetical protein
MDVLFGLFGCLDGDVRRLSKAIQRMADIVSSDSVTRAFLALSQRRDPSQRRIHLLDRATRRPMFVTSLAQLPLGRLFVFGEGHTVQRISNDRVLLAGKISIPLCTATPVLELDAEPTAELDGVATPEPAASAPQWRRAAVLTSERTTAFAPVALSDAAREGHARRADEVRAKRVASLARRTATLIAAAVDAGDSSDVGRARGEQGKHGGSIALGDRSDAYVPDSDDDV